MNIWVWRIICSLNQLSFKEMIAFKLKLLMNKTHKKKHQKKKNPEKRTPQWLTKPPKLLSSNRIPIMANRDYRTKNPINFPTWNSTDLRILFSELSRFTPSSMIERSEWKFFHKSTIRDFPVFVTFQRRVLFLYKTVP